MAGISTKEIKNRIRSMQSTRQITRAMEMVAASKLRRAQSQVNNARPYCETLCATIHDIANAGQDLSSVYLTQRPLNKTAWVVIAGDRGLAGGYNSNVLKRAWSEMDGEEVAVLPIGRKALDCFRSGKTEILSQQFVNAEELSVGDCFRIGKDLCRQFQAGKWDEVRIAYTNFVSLLSQSPTTMRILPLARQKTKSKAVSADMLYEPDPVTVLEAIIPEYVGGILYGALCESRAAEQAARRIAMDAATKNADEMIGALSLRYNRARQAAITSEIIDIVAGS